MGTILLDTFDYLCKSIDQKKEEICKSIYLNLKDNSNQLPDELLNWQETFSSYSTRGYWPRFTELISMTNPNSKSYKYYESFLYAVVFWTQKSGNEEYLFNCVEKAVGEYVPVSDIVPVILADLFSEKDSNSHAREHSPLYEYYFGEDSPLFDRFIKKGRIFKGLSKDEIEKYCIQLEEQCQHQFLLKYLLLRKRRDQKRQTILYLLSQNLKVHSTDDGLAFEVLPPLSMYLANMTHDIDVFLNNVNSERFKYCRRDFLMTLGILAEAVDDDSTEHFVGNLDRIKAKDEFNLYVLEDIQNGTIPWLVTLQVDQRTEIKFASKPDRFFFKAMYNTLELEAINAHAESYFHNIMEYAESLNSLQAKEQPDKSTDLRQSKVERFLLYSYFLICNISIPHIKKNIIVDCLCETALVTMVSARARQTAAVNLLACLLAESSISLDGNAREKIMRHTYANNYYYPWLFEEFNCMKSRNPSIEEYAAKSIRTAVQLDEDGYALGQPYYLILAGRVPLNNDFIDKCGNLFKLVWPTYDEKTISRSAFLVQADTLLYEADTHLSSYIDYPDAPGSSILKYAYGMMVLGFAISNVVSSGFEESSPAAQSMSQRILKTIIYSDYIIRKKNKEYNNWDGRSANAGYLFLCGEYRVTCTHEYCLSSKIALTNDMKKMYLEWLNKEKNSRYEMLMIRFLSYSDFFSDGEGKKYLEERKMDLEHMRIPPIEFLGHDNIIGFNYGNMQKNSDFLKCPATLQAAQVR